MYIYIYTYTAYNNNGFVVGGGHANEFMPTTSFAVIYVWVEGRYSGVTVSTAGRRTSGDAAASPSHNDATIFPFVSGRRSSEACLCKLCPDYHSSGSHAPRRVWKLGL